RDARWIVHEHPFEFLARLPDEYVVVFRKRFTLPTPVAGAVLLVSPFRLAEVRLDGEVVLEDPAPAFADWKRPRSVPLTRALPAGPQGLVVRVTKENAPPALLLRSDTLDVATGPSWDARLPDGDWEPAGLATTPRPAPLSRFLPPAPSALLEKLPLLAT